MGMWDAFRQDVKYGLRSLFRAPEFALVGVLTLGLGIGANTAVFSVVDSVLLNPLPYDDPGGIVWVREKNVRGGPMAVAWANYVDWRAEATSFETLAAHNSASVTVLGAAEPLVARVTQTTQELWPVFGVGAARGRLTTPDDHRPGAEAVAVVSERFWAGELGAPALDALFLEVRGVRLRVVGVAAAGFDYPAETDLWTPVPEADQLMYRSSHNWEVTARLAPGATLEGAAVEMDQLTLRLVEGSAEDPDFLATGAVLRTLHEQLVGGARTSLLLLLGAAGLVLLVACTNLASTLLARGSGRARELAVRASLGAPRERIARQLLTEHVLLAGCGLAVGLLVAAGMLAGLRALGPESVPRLDEVAIRGSVLVYAAAIAGVTVLVFGVLPARRLSRPDAIASLKGGGRGASADARSPVWRVLVAGEVALALVLAVASVLVVRSFQNLLAEEAGFDATDVVTLTLSLSQSKYESAAAQAEWHRGFLDELRTLPGVAAAGFIGTVPLDGFLANGRLQLDDDLEKGAVAGYVLADGGAFAALDIPLVRGRVFDDRDGPDAPHVAIVSQSFADSYWPGEDPIGRTVSGGGMDEFWQERRFAEVVGVVGDVRFRGLGRESEPTVYFPYRQRPMRIQFVAHAVVESENDRPAALVPMLRQTLAAADPDVPPRIRPLGDAVAASVAPQRFMVVLLGAFAALSLVLAWAGIYGVVSYQVAQRTREMGIRMALGGAPASVRALVLRQSLTVVAAGLVIGLIGVAVGGRVMTSLLYGVKPVDPVSILLAVAALTGAALLASWVPATRGTRVDPAITMRAE